MDAHNARTNFIFGGARSGKSQFAETLCHESDCDLLYVATSPVIKGDAEYADRIKMHQDRRGPRWRVIEEELALAEILKAESRPDLAILIDCMTLWLNNVLYHNLSLEDRLKAFIEAMQTCQSRIILISNEVGQGIVPSNPEVRGFRDHQGRLNQTLAAHCDRVIEVRAGLPLILKPIQQPAITL
ncbi:bifunctional adenosylcobinamide kinase/adenosylcobinamide-phosphate guanylyltransferase [Cohaesibacter intestini]|uniref:bifunctional adenosylcobinamide kinase/adenosylcobinamide-phosphate guanylyltransferase n=1 Tax=Cohaesibacter intestini TaxID=2211145 RepID=UPI000DE8CA89|nr:bifunctional adenosylcobinamide kinase/adenosylcobinamide-phosphate guanylyltransferase [Cohaesibacter intestini]